MHTGRIRFTNFYATVLDWDHLQEVLHNYWKIQFFLLRKMNISLIEFLGDILIMTA